MKICAVESEQDDIGGGLVGGRGKDEHKTFVINWPEEKMISLNLQALLKHYMLFINHSFFSFYKEIQYSISFDIFTILHLEQVQSLHLVLKEVSSCIEAISKSQNTHSEKLSLLLTFSKHTVAMHHLLPTRTPPKVSQGCQFPHAYIRIILKKCLFAEEFHFYWYANQKFTVSPGRVHWF